MPSLIRELAVAGSRKSDGSANASGKVFLYEPGTTTIVAGYKDDSLSEAWARSGGGIPLDAGGRVKIWINDIVDVAITDADGATVDYMLGYNKTRAEQVEIENDAFTGALTDESGAVSQALGGVTTLDAILTTGAASLGDNFKYKESTGATSRPYIEVITGLRVSVKDFGAIGNGIADDGTAVQKAIVEAMRLGATLIFEQGTYMHASPLAVTSASFLNIEGRGFAILRSSSATANGLVMTACGGCSISDLTIDSASGSTGTALSFAGANNGITLDNVNVSNTQVNIDLVGSNFVLRNVKSSITSSRALRSAAVNLQVFGGAFVSGTSAAIEFKGAAARTSIFGADFTGSSTGILFDSSLSGTKFVIAGCPSLGALGTAGINVTASTIWPELRQWGNGVRGPAELSFATGTSQTPVIMLGNEILLTASSGGAAAVTVNMPAIVPSGPDADDLYYDFVFKNAAGGAVTWNTVAGYVLNGAVAVPATAAHTIQIRFRWDSATSKLRECSRGDTVT